MLRVLHLPTGRNTYPIINPPLIQPLSQVVHSGAENRLQRFFFGGGGRYDNIHFFLTFLHNIGKSKRQLNFHVSQKLHEGLNRGVHLSVVG